MKTRIVLAAFGLTDIGRCRKENQDAFVADPALGLYLVSDGMGGLNSGAVASKAVAELFPKLLAPKLPKSSRKALLEDLKDAVASFSEMLREKAKEEPRLRGMGATLVMALVRGSDAYLLHLGDSRAYLFAKGALKRLTRDHTVAGVLEALGKISEAEARSHPARHALSRYVGMNGKAVADALRLKLKAGERLLFCTDGLTNMLTDEAIGAVLSEEKTVEGACRKLVAKANEAGGGDNITALVMEFSRNPG